MPAKTSATHRLRIDRMSCGAGVVGMTLCPGKHASSAFGGYWERDLGLDLREVVDWGATTLVSIIERSELSAFGVSNIGEAAEEAGLEWHHLPIKDVHIPDERFERRWPYSGHVLRRRLQSGERIVLHCRGGLGRTGTIAARLAIELGETPQTALRRVREARKGAVETHEQEAYVLQKPFSVPDAGYADRVLGCLLGGAVGDAFGYGVEFTKLPQIRQRFGPQGIQQPVLNRHGEAEVSDDTQLTLFTLEGLLAGIRPGAPINQAKKQATSKRSSWPPGARRRLTVILPATLSYFIEPNPGSSASFDPLRYQSFGLRFDLKRRSETTVNYMKRLNKQVWEHPKDRPDADSDTDNWLFGTNSMSAGSLHSDEWTGPAVNLLSRDMICIKPVGGWWNDRANADVRAQKARYSLVLSLRSEDSDVDLYTPFASMIRAETEVEEVAIRP